MENILKAQSLSRTVVDRGKRLKIIDDLTYSFSAGKLYALVGSSGSGKSSFLRLLNRLDEPDSGTVFYNGRDYRTLPAFKLRRKIGYLFQSPHMFEKTIEDNLRYGQDDLSRHEVERYLSLVGLKPDDAGRAVEKLSGGERQRVALARLLAIRPDVLLLDEATAGLDHESTIFIEQLITSLVLKDNICVIMVTHYRDQIQRLGGEMLVMSRGKLIKSGSADKLLASIAESEIFDSNGENSQ